jgi:hypothetical protein
LSWQLDQRHVDRSVERVLEIKRIEARNLGFSGLWRKVVDLPLAPLGIVL